VLEKGSVVDDRVDCAGEEFTSGTIHAFPKSDRRRFSDSVSFKHQYLNIMKNRWNRVARYIQDNCEA
jgi:hypothetical protein